MPIKRSQKVDVLKNLRGTLSVRAGECSRLRTTAPPIPSHPFRPRWHSPRLAGRDFRSRSGSDSTKTARATSSGAAPASAISSPSADQMPERPPHGSPRRTTRREPRPSAAPPRCSTAEPPRTPTRVSRRAGEGPRRAAGLSRLPTERCAPLRTRMTQYGSPSPTGSWATSYSSDSGKKRTPPTLRWRPPISSTGRPGPSQPALLWSSSPPSPKPIVAARGQHGKDRPRRQPCSPTR